MTEPTPPTERPDGPVCPWCSTAVTPETVTCPSCKAVLISDEEPNLPGVTAVDLKVIAGERPPQRNRLLSWISGEYPEEIPTETNAQAIAPPDPAVQREIRRLEFEAEVANLQAEADALLSEAVAEGRIVVTDEAEDDGEGGSSDGEAAPDVTGGDDGSAIEEAPATEETPPTDTTEQPTDVDAPPA
jgi:hypothetical protein